MALTVAAMRTLMLQQQEVAENPVDGVRPRPLQELSVYHFDLDGPQGTPFAQGRFHVALSFDEHYPSVPPKGTFKTKIFHPNISDRGDICVNALKRDWSPQLGLRHVLIVIRCLLIEPNPESALNDEAGRLLLEDYAAYERKAVMHTSIYAMRPPGEPRFTTSRCSAEAIDGSGQPTSKADSSDELSGSRAPTTTASTAATTSAAAAASSAVSAGAGVSDGLANEKAKKSSEKKKRALRRI